MNTNQGKATKIKQQSKAKTVKKEKKNFIQIQTGFSQVVLLTSRKER